MGLPFNAWVKKFGGADELAKTLGVTGHAVRVWLRGDGSPLGENMITLIRLSKGKLGFEAIYRESIRSKKVSRKSL